LRIPKHSPRSSRRLAQPVGATNTTDAAQRHDRSNKTKAATAKIGLWAANHRRIPFIRQSGAALADGKSYRCNRLWTRKAAAAGRDFTPVSASVGRAHAAPAVTDLLVVNARIVGRHVQAQ